MGWGRDLSLPSHRRPLPTSIEAQIMKSYSLLLATSGNDRDDRLEADVLNTLA